MMSKTNFWIYRVLYDSYESAVRLSLNVDFGVPAYLTRKYVEQSDLKTWYFEDNMCFRSTTPKEAAARIMKELSGDGRTAILVQRKGQIPSDRI